MEYDLGFDAAADFSVPSSDVFGDSAVGDFQNGFDFSDLAPRGDDILQQFGAEPEQDTLITESKDTVPLADEWTEQELDILRDAVQRNKSAIVGVTNEIRALFPSKTDEQIQKQITLVNARQRSSATNATLMKQEPLPPGQEAPLPKKRAPKPKTLHRSASSPNTTEDSAATSPNMSEYVPEEEEVAAVELSSDGDYEEPSGVRRRRGGSASAATVAGKSTGASSSKKRSNSIKSEPGTKSGSTAPRSNKKPKLEEDPSGFGPSSTGPSSFTAPAGLSPGGTAQFHPPSRPMQRPPIKGEQLTPPVLYGPGGQRLNIAVLPPGAPPPIGVPVNPGAPPPQLSPQGMPPGGPPRFQAPQMRAMYPPNAVAGAQQPLATAYSANVRQQLEAVMNENEFIIRAIKDNVHDPLRNLDFMLRFRENTFELLRLCSRQPQCFEHMPVLPVRIQSLQTLIHSAHTSKYRETINPRMVPMQSPYGPPHPQAPPNYLRQPGGPPPQQQMQQMQPSPPHQHPQQYQQSQPQYSLQQPPVMPNAPQLQQPLPPGGGYHSQPARPMQQPQLGMGMPGRPPMPHPQQPMHG